MKPLFSAFAAIALAAAGVSGHAAGVPGQGTWQSTLQARDLDGNLANGPEAFYDTELNITWLRAGSTSLMQLSEARAWSEQVRFGLSGWRLPKTVDTGAAGCDFSYGGTDCGYNPDASIATGSEMAHLFFASLGNNSPYVPGPTPGTGLPQAGAGLTNTGGFLNLYADGYWSGTSYLSSGTVWNFDMNSGYQGYGGLISGFYALAVRDGDVSAVPEPQAYALLLAGLGLIAGVARRRSGQR
jgi:hypothetical protein